MDVIYKKEFKKIQNFFAAGEYEKVIEKTKVLLKKIILKFHFII